jgi:hypothetical protein
MSRFQVGMKLYDLEWYLKYKMSYQDAARCLRDWGVTFVLAQNRLLPMPDSAVKSEVPPELAHRYATYDDRRFRDSLGEEGIEYWPAVCLFYDPTVLDADPSLRPIGSDGRRMQKVDWYEGIAPSAAAYVAAKTAAIEQAVHALEPEGIFLSFTRWPGFWELWTPDRTRHDFPEYSYDQHTLRRFVHDTGVNLQTRGAAGAASWIEANVRDTWTRWKCQVVVDVIHGVRDACREVKPGVQIMLNTLPFGVAEFDGAREKVFGQCIETLSSVVDLFEVMTYHQILKRPTAWIPEAGLEVKQRSRRRTMCTIQARPLYLEGIHARSGRSPELDEKEFAEAVDAVEESGLDGLVVFVWSDLLQDVVERNNTQRVDAIRAAVERRQARLQ